MPGWEEGLPLISWLTGGETLLGVCFPVSSFLLCFLLSLHLGFYYPKHFRVNWIEERATMSKISTDVT